MIETKKWIDHYQELLAEDEQDYMTESLTEEIDIHRNHCGYEQKTIKYLKNDKTCGTIVEKCFRCK